MRAVLERGPLFALCTIIFFAAASIQLPTKKFIYLFQTPELHSLPDVLGPESDQLVLCWKVPPPSPNENVLWFPNSSLNAGRNKLLEVARLRGDYLYYIFADDDLRLQERRDYGMNTGNPFRTLERYLVEWEPAVGVVLYHGQQFSEKNEVQLTYGFDGVFGAFHREVIDFLLPYTTVFDSESWWYSNFCVNTLAAAFFNDHRIQFNALVIPPGTSVGHQNYPHERDYPRPLHWLLPAIKDQGALSRIKMDPHAPDFAVVKWGVASKKKGPYTIDASRYDRCHDYFFRPSVLQHTCDSEDSAAGTKIHITYPCNATVVETDYAPTGTLKIFFEIPCLREARSVFVLRNGHRTKTTFEPNTPNSFVVEDIEILPMSFTKIEVCLNPRNCDSIFVRALEYVHERHPVPKARFTWPHKNDTVFDLADPKSAARLAYFVDNFKMPDGSMRAGVQFSSCPHTEGVAQLVVNGEVKAETSYPDVSVSLAEFENGEHEAFVVLMDEAGEEVARSSTLSFIILGGLEPTNADPAIYKDPEL